MTDMSSSLGFWSLDPATGVLTCCPTAVEILELGESNSRMLRDVLLRLIPVDRRRLFRAGLASLKRRSTFDRVVFMRTPVGTKLLRVIGGAAYGLEHRDPHMHGLVEQIALQDSVTAAVQGT